MTFPSRTDTTLSAWAHAYAEAGWPVFPLTPRNKTPIPSKGFKAATLDHDLIEAWWTATPDANIGGATGHIFDVLDVDGDEGVRFLKSLWRDLGIEYRHEGPVSLTGKGWHFLCAPTGLGNGANIGGDAEKKTKLDFRGMGGYIVLPPSIHPLGHRYQWDEERGPDSPIATAPSWLTTLLDREHTPDARDPHQIIKSDLTRPYIEAMAAILPDQLPRGLRQRLERPDILEVCAAKGMHLRKHSHYYLTNCPIHDDSTPSCAIYPRNNTWYCYGCQAHGDSFDLQRGTHL